jgi:hypothetical protein
MGKPTIKELEELLEREEQAELEILPNGEIRHPARPKDSGTSAPQNGASPRPLTFREDLGGEYSERR